MNVYGLKKIRKIVVIQLFIVAALALFMLMLLNKHEALSALLGGICAIIPGVVFAIRHFQHQGAQASKQILQGFYMAEVLKIVTSVILIAFVLLTFHVRPFGFLLAYIIAIMAIWLAPLVLNEHKMMK